MLIGNKCDAINNTKTTDSTCDSKEREVSFDEGLKLAIKHGFSFCEVSAKSGFNVTLAFETLVSNIIASEVNIKRPTIALIEGATA